MKILIQFKYPAKHCSPMNCKIEVNINENFRTALLQTLIELNIIKIKYRALKKNYFCTRIRFLCNYWM